MLRIFLWILLGVLPSLASPQKLKVVASFSILGDLVRQVGQDLVEVSIIVPENADPHIYQPKPLDIIKINEADLVFVNGLSFEGWFGRLIVNSGYKGDIITAGKNVKPRILLDSKGVSATDPHAWHSVKNAMLYVEEIKKALQHKLPHYTKKIEENAASYSEKLKKLDDWVKEQFKTSDKKRHIVITTHDAFSYYGTDYGIEFLSPVGISTDSEASAAVIAEMIRTIKEKNVKAVFIENLSNRKLIEQIAAEARVNVDGVLYADSLSSPSTASSPARTYIEMIQHNTQTIREALEF